MTDRVMTTLTFYGLDVSKVYAVERAAREAAEGRYDSTSISSTDIDKIPDSEMSEASIRQQALDRARQDLPEAATQYIIRRAKDYERFLEHGI